MMGSNSRRARPTMAAESANLRADRAARLGSDVDVGEAGVGRCVVVAAFAYSA